MFHHFYNLRLKSTCSYANEEYGRWDRLCIFYIHVQVNVEVSSFDLSPLFTYLEYIIGALLSLNNTHLAISSGDGLISVYNVFQFINQNLQFYFCLYSLFHNVLFLLSGKPIVLLLCQPVEKEEEITVKVL